MRCYFDTLILLIVFYTIILRKHRNEETSDVSLSEEKVFSRFVEQSAGDSRFASMQLKGAENTSKYSLSTEMAAAMNVLCSDYCPVPDYEGGTHGCWADRRHGWLCY